MKKIEDIEFYTVEYWQEHWDELMDRVENGETIGVENEEGHGKRSRLLSCCST